ncbi:MASE1 domain-containing protein [Bradyrhizobium jicamae]|uniref:MASE1 domain-containing protein n=1 Tax=Bradyrhizobium jicamae TaxID=280332 RepID=UPI0018DE6FC8|nr:MASE1 domain-containing protein [Bradyrhizobium jicamae]
MSVAVAIAFFLAARFSFALLDKSDGVAVFWPAAGVATGILVAFGPAVRWPVVIGVAAATVAANLLGDRNLASTVFFAVANASGPLIVSGLIQRFCGAPFELNELRRVFGLFAATIITAMISGLVGMLGFVLFHAPAASPVKAWSHWLVSETVGTIVVAPLVIGLASFLRNAPPKREIVEGIFALAIVAAVCALRVNLPDESWTLKLMIALLCPLFVWIAARVRPAFTAVAAFMCAISIVWATTFSLGIFGDVRLSFEERTLSAQASILAISFGALVLAALFNERRVHELAILEREQRLEEALRAGGVITFDWDLQTDLIEVSRNAAEVLGLAPQQFINGANWIKQVHPVDYPSVAARLGTVRPDDPSHSIAFRFIRPDGRGEVWLEQVAITRVDSAGKPIRIGGLMTDITERKRFEGEISRAWKSAALADRAKSSFLSAASHDLRQPLQTLRFLQGALGLHLTGGEGRELVDKMARSLDTMSSILSSLLDVNRLEAGSLRPSMSDFAITEIFDSLAADFSDAITDRGLRWCMVRSALLVRSDKRMLETMIRNLLSNALRYTDRGRILLGCRRVGDKVRIEVWDSGIGITQDQLPHIFQEYYQGSPEAERGGFGLGLAIVRRLGEMLDHPIGAHSTPGKGTVITIEIPRGDGNGGRRERAQKPRYEKGDFRGTILVVEDEASVRASISRLLKARGIEAIVVATASDALTRVHRQEIRPDLLLCDYNLQGSTNGVTTIGDLRAALGRSIPAIVMTGDIRSEVVEPIAAQGISVLLKPFLADDLLQHIARLSREQAAAGPADPTAR